MGVSVNVNVCKNQGTNLQWGVLRLLPGRIGDCRIAKRTSVWTTWRGATHLHLR